MRYYSRFALTFGAMFVFAVAGRAQAPKADIARLRVVAQPSPGTQAIQADVVVIGKIAEIEKDTVEAAPFKGANKDQRVAYKIAILKIDDAIIGGKGLTQFRVGFPADAPAATPQPVPPGGGARPPGRILPGRTAVALTVGQEGCFFLNPHHEADFYVMTYGGPTDKKDENFTKKVDDIKKTAKIINDPVAALKSKELDDRFQAAYVMLLRYQMNRSGKATSREPIPEDENKLILGVMAELPWQPTDMTLTETNPVPRGRSTLWNMIQQDVVGFKQPVFPAQKAGDPPIDYNKIWDEATTSYLKDNKEKIKIKGFLK